MDFLFVIALICYLIAVLLEAWNRAAETPLPPPVAITILSIQEDSMDQKYIYTFGLEKPKSHDVIIRHLHVIIDGIEEISDIAIDAVSHSITFAENASVEMFLIDEDDAHNMSIPSESLSFVVLDTIPPAAPGVIIISDIVEVPMDMEPEVPAEEPPVVEEPVVEEPVIEEPVVEVPAEEPVVEEPVIEVPAEEPVVEEPVVEEPVVEVPAEEPVVEEPVVIEEPVVVDPVVVEEPVVEENTDEANG